MWQLRRLGKAVLGMQGSHSAKNIPWFTVNALDKLQDEETKPEGRPTDLYLHRPGQCHKAGPTFKAIKTRVTGLEAMVKDIKLIEIYYVTSQYYNM